MFIFRSALLAAVIKPSVGEIGSSSTMNMGRETTLSTQGDAYGASIEEACGRHYDQASGQHKVKYLEACRAVLLRSSPIRQFKYIAKFEDPDMSFSSCPVAQHLSEMGGKWTSFRGPIEMRGTLLLYKVSDSGDYAFTIEAKPYEYDLPLSITENNFRRENNFEPEKVNVEQVFKAHKDAPVYFASQNRYEMFNISTATIESNIQVHLQLNLEEGGKRGRRINLVDLPDGPCFESYNVELIRQK